MFEYFVNQNHHSTFKRHIQAFFFHLLQKMREVLEDDGKGSAVHSKVIIL